MSLHKESDGTPAGSPEILTGGRVAPKLRDAILRGALPLGMRVRQEDLAGEHGSSRLSVKEALRILEGNGLVSLITNSGAWVSAVTLTEYEKIYRIRQRMKPLLLRYTISPLDDEAVEHLRTLAEEMEARKDTEEFLRLDRDFHLSSYSADHTVLLSEMTLRLWNRTQHYRRIYVRTFRADGEQIAHHDHHLIVAALKRRDAHKAEKQLSSHICRTRLQLARHPEVIYIPKENKELALWRS